MLIQFQSIEYLARSERQGHTNLEPNAIHLWGVELDGSPGCLEQCTQWLDEEERQRAARLIRDEDRQRFVFAHGGLRVILSRYLEVSSEMIEIRRSEGGKPFLGRELQGQSSIMFNMSHSHGRMLIAVSKGQEVGVDLERIRSDVEVAKLSARYFAPSEHAVMMQSDEEDRAAWFFRYWVSKEAVLKAQGVGLQGLSECEVLLGADGIGTEIRVPFGSRIHNNWTVRRLLCGEGWEAAVAAQGKDWVVQCGAAL